MLRSITDFPLAGSHALIDWPIMQPDGRVSGIRRRRVRVQQLRADGRLLVTAPGGRVRFGLRTVDVAPIQRTVDVADLRPVPKRFRDRVIPA